MGVLGRSGDGHRWPRFRPPRPAGIRNGGLLVLVGLAAVMALVDEPPEAGRSEASGRRRPAGPIRAASIPGLTGRWPLVA